MIAIEILKLIVLVIIAIILFGMLILMGMYMDAKGIIDMRSEEQKERDRILNESKKKPRMVIRGFYQEES